MPRLHVGELELDRLQLVDRLAEGDPLLRVLVGVVGRALGDARRPARRRPRRVRSSVPSATPRPLPSSPIRFSCGTRTSSKIGEPVGEPLMPSLCSSLPTVEALAVGLDDEGADAPVLAVGDGEDDVEVGDRRRW